MGLDEHPSRPDSPDPQGGAAALVQRVEGDPDPGADVGPRVQEPARRQRGVSLIKTYFFRHRHSSCKC